MTNDTVASPPRCHKNDDRVAILRTGFGSEFQTTGAEHPIAAYYSFIDLERMKG